jgi:transcriptional regulator with XRE-family HTH domain
MRRMKTFVQVIREARKSVGLTQKAVAEHLQRGDGRKVLPPFLNDLEFDRRLPPENAVIEQLAKILKLSPDILYFYAKRLPGDIEHNVDEERIIAAYRAWRAALDAPANVRA